MVRHGAFSSKANARKYCKKMRKKGLKTSMYVKKGKWYVSSFR